MSGGTLQAHRRRTLAALGALGALMSHGLPAGGRLLLGGGALLAGCRSTQPAQWYELRADPPAAVLDTASPASPAGTPAGMPGTAGLVDADGVWALSMAVQLPGALGRDTLVVARGQAGLLPLTGHRWTEPLRDSVPRVLLADLQRLRGPGRVWPAPVPAGVVATQRLRVALGVLQPAEDRRTLRLAAQWWLQPAQPVQGQAGRAPQAASADFHVAVQAPTVDALAGAHRLALWRLAERIAAGGSR